MPIATLARTSSSSRTKDHVLFSVESIPVCESSISASNNDLSMSSDVNIWMQCSVNFSTVDYFPSMEWMQHHKETELIRNDSVTITTNTTVISVLNLSIGSINNGSYFSCMTFFKPHNGPVKTTASNTPDFRFIWNSTKIVSKTNKLSADIYLDDKNILMSSNGKIFASVTTVLIDGIAADSSSNYWCEYNSWISSLEQNFSCGILLNNRIGNLIIA